MTINPSTLNLFDEYYWEWAGFLAKFNYHNEPKKDIEAERKMHRIKWGKDTYPIETIYSMLRSMDRTTELIPRWVKLKENSQIKEEDVPTLNEEFRKLIKKYLDQAEELRKQIIVTPLPPKQPSEFQNLFYKLDPYCKKIKEKFSKLYQLIDEEDLKEKVLTPEEQKFEERYMKGATARFRNDSFLGQIKVPYLTPRMEKQQDLKTLKKQLDLFMQSNTKWDMEALRALYRINEEEYEENPYHPESYREPYKEPLGTSLSRLLKDKFHCFANDYETALNYFKDLIENEIGCLASVFINVRLGINLQVYADEIDLPKDLKKCIWEDGYAIENNLDVRGTYRFFLRCYPQYINGNTNRVEFELVDFIKKEEHKIKIIEYAKKAENIISSEATFQGIFKDRYLNNLAILKKIILEQ